ncbi:membrane-associated protein, putative [Bodo saltans]|uniref:Membrane-associated protein, putative n=1 Tax=Bodo saltans TaxID=75058 RepID=A0A0S4J105_BODSA|nr:membrane-associated protein, putative [Bodo saltans]|eukprot:CUG77222.1 membrane-associated protein, putative [Bodo saltans]
MGAKWSDVLLSVLCIIIAASVWISPTKQSSHVAINSSSDGAAAVGLAARWDFIGVLPPYRLMRWWYAQEDATATQSSVSSDEEEDTQQRTHGPSSSSSSSPRPPPRQGRSDLFSVLLLEGRSVMFSVVHVAIAVGCLLASSGPPLSASAMSFRLLLSATHFIVLCMFGSVELGLRIGGSVLLPPKILEEGVDINELMQAHYHNAATNHQPLASMFSHDVAGLFVPSMVLSCLIFIVAILDLAKVEDDFDAPRIAASPSHPSSSEQQEQERGAATLVKAPKSAAKELPTSSTMRKRK